MCAKVQYPIPFSSDRLRELYWDEGKTLRQIAECARELAGWHKAPGHDTIKKWIVANGIAVMDMSARMRRHANNQKRAGVGMFAPESKQLRADIERESWRPVKIGATISKRAHPRKGTRHSAASIAKMKVGHATGKQPPKRGRSIDLICEWCHKPFSRIISQLSRHPDSKHVFCSLECCGRHKVAFNTSMLTLTCQRCGTTFERKKYWVKPGKPVFCSRKCAVTYRTADLNHPV